MACGLQHAALAQDGEVLTWGKASGGRLGQGDIVEVSVLLASSNILLMICVNW